MLATVLGLGGWAFEQRQLNQHTLRLQRLLEKTPVASAVTAGLLLEPDASLVASRASAEPLVALVRRWSAGQQDLVLRAAREWSRTDVFEVGPMTYFLYFDDDDILRHFVCLRN